MKKLCTGAELAKYAVSFVGSPYWYGTYINACTESKLQSKARQYPTHYTTGRLPRYRDDIRKKKIAMDCVGFEKGAAWGSLGKNPVKYASNGVPDRSADGMFRWAKDQGAAWGTIKTIPEVVGLGLWSSGHVGTYLGNGEVFEARGFAHGCVITKLKARPWTHWFERPWVEYSNAPVVKPPATLVFDLGSRLIENYTIGDDVLVLQRLLVTLGYNIGPSGPDSKYGKDTAKAVKAFQKDNGLKVDGKYGDNTHAALMGLVASMDREEDADDKPVEAAPKTLKVTGTSVHIRTGPGTQYDIVTFVFRDRILPWVAVSANNWYSVEINGKVGWISGKYVKID